MKVRSLLCVLPGMVAFFVFFDLCLFSEKEDKQVQVIYINPSISSERHSNTENNEIFPGVSLEEFHSSFQVSRSESLSRHPDYKSFNISCFPRFTEYVDSLYFSATPSKTYKKCEMSSSATLNHLNSSIKVQCVKSSYNSLFIDPGSEEVFGLNDFPVSWEAFQEKSEIPSTKGQFLFIRCAKSEVYSFVFNRFLSEVSKKHKNRVENLEKFWNLSKTRALTVYVLMFDSLSRQNFYRSMTKTVNYLQSSLVTGTHSGKFKIFDFTLTNTIELNTKPNLFPILYGKSLKSIQDELDLMNPKNLSTNPGLLQLQKKYSIWEFFSSLGFVTLFSYDTTFDFVSKVTGKKITTDFQLFNFWNAGKRIFGYNDFIDRQRCFGDRDAHWFSLDYNSQFLRNYRNQSRFVYSHLSPGHESSGVIQTADEDLKEHIEKVLNFYSELDEDFVMLVLSDHGRAQGKLEFDLEQFVEQRIPLTLFITNSEFLAKTGSFKHLQINTKRLISRYDLHLSLKTLALSPFGKLKTSDYQQWKAGYQVNCASLWMETIDDRMCEETGARKIDCICKDYQRVDFLEDLENITLKLIEKLSLQALNKYRSRKLRTFLIFDLKMKDAQVFLIKNQEEGASKRYMSHFLYKEKNNEENEIEVVASFAKVSRFVETRARLDDTSGVNPSEIFKHNGTDYQVQIINMKFKDFLRED
jgi:hypothetical protein